jgi:polyhydroxybutyrate depolymerase
VPAALLARRAARESVREITVGQDVRRYLLHVPPSYRAGAKVPLVVVLHGGGGNGRGAEKMTGFSQKADREGFLVVYPYGWGRFDETLLTWNAGSCCGLAMDQNKNDVEFIRHLVHSIKTGYDIDEKRIYATGMSNGAMMSYRLACEMSEVFAAAAPVAGALNIACNPANPVSIVIVHGRADQHVLYEGGAPTVMKDSHARVDKSVEYAVDFFRKHNNCREKPVQTIGKLETRSFDCATAGLRVHSLADEGHTWPGGQKGYFGADAPSQEFSATDAIWDFFKEHPKPQ